MCLWIYWIRWHTVTSWAFTGLVATTRLVTAEEWKARWGRLGSRNSDLRNIDDEKRGKGEMWYNREGEEEIWRGVRQKKVTERRDFFTSQSPSHTQPDPVIVSRRPITASPFHSLSVSTRADSDISIYKLPIRYPEISSVKIPLTI